LGDIIKMKLNKYLAVAMVLNSFVIFSSFAGEEVNSDLGNSSFAAQGLDQGPADVQMFGGHGGGGHGGGFPGHGGGHGGGFPGHGGGFPGHGHGGFPGGHHFDPYPIHHGYNPWNHWAHPFFPRPIYHYDWYRVRAMTCTAVDAYGSEYPVTQSDYSGYDYYTRLDEIEDSALDRCYQETDGDASCRLLGCTPGY
jgi:hypothetical protein